MTRQKIISTGRNKLQTVDDDDLGFRTPQLLGYRRAN